ncbi:hypothetical protein CGLO_09638 [Colletotrichum gloeosporioides Cg-14]|uniref:Uncharacterized protein n=1 Tax=Colletotrichum gloeosporioides (strain Cg-14) TaxID=1237896 RepID=T0K5X3_COLGC|nr:hypothetical protein CGLO_09638 [Colletotrichum gloeosporioides Cg-14]
MNIGMMLGSSMGGKAHIL